MPRITATKFSTSNVPGGVSWIVEVGDKLISVQDEEVNSLSPEMGRYAIFDKNTGSGTLYTGLNSTAQARIYATGFVYNGYAWTLYDEVLYRIDPDDGDLTTYAVDLDGSGQAAVAVDGSTAYAIVDSGPRLFAVDLTDQSTTLIQDTGIAGPAKIPWEGPGITTNSPSEVTLASDGALWYLGNDGANDMLQRVELDGTVETVTTAGTYRSLNVIELGGYIYYGGDSEFVRVDMSTGTRTTYATQGDVDLVGALRVGSDGNIYCHGRDATTFHIFRPDSNTTTKATVPGVVAGQGNRHYLFKSSNDTLWLGQTLRVVDESPSTGSWHRIDNLDARYRRGLGLVH
jgi:hypothetical protein